MIYKCCFINQSPGSQLNTHISFVFTDKPNESQTLNCGKERELQAMATSALAKRITHKSASAGWQCHR